MLAFGFETLTVASGDVATGLSRHKYNPAGQHLPVRQALVTVNPGPQLSYMFISTVTVGSAIGHLITPYASIMVNGFDDIRNFRLTSVSSGTIGSISVTYFK